MTRAPVKVFHLGAAGRRWCAFCRWCAKCILCDQEFWQPTFDAGYNHLTEEHKDKMAAGGV